VRVREGHDFRALVGDAVRGHDEVPAILSQAHQECFEVQGLPFDAQPHLLRDHLAEFDLEA
jgi:hypothetical protein